MSELARFIFYPTSNYIEDRWTGYTYFCNNRKVCELLNELNGKIDHTPKAMKSARNVVEIEMWKKMLWDAQEIAVEYMKKDSEVWKILRKYNIDSLEKLDQVLMNERTW